MKVAVVSSVFPASRPGGVGTYVVGRSTYLDRRVNVFVLALGSAHGAREVSLGSIHGFKFKFLLVWMKLLWTLLKIRPDVIEVHNIPVGLPLFFVSKPRYFFHGPAVLEAKAEGATGARLSIIGMLERFVIWRSGRVLLASKTFRRLFVSLYPKYSPKHLRVIYPKMAFDAPAGLPAMERHFVCVRRLVARTGVDILIKAFGEAVRSGQLADDVVLYIVGQGSERIELEALAAQQPGAHRIKFEGRVSQKRRDALFATAIAQIVPTRELEGFGLVVLEAAAFGCPSLVTPVGALPEVIDLLEGRGVVASEAELPAALGAMANGPAMDRAALANHVRRKFGV